ncbi:MAG: glutathione S-transferase family protein [Kofleriaceae bacterium]
MKLYYHPKSPYSHKVMIALAEKGAAFEACAVKPSDPAFRALTPLAKVPLLVLADGWKIPESSIIVEYLDAHVDGGTRLIPAGIDLARQTRFHDRITDLYVTEPLMALLFGVGDAAAAHARLDALFAGYDDQLAKRAWVMGEAFSLADCALLPALRYARTLHPFERWPHLSAYAARGLERPSVKALFAELAPHLAAA